MRSSFDWQAFAFLVGFAGAGILFLHSVGYVQLVAAELRWFGL